MNPTKRKILIVDDEQSIRDSLKLLLKSTFEVFTAEDGREALECLESIQPEVILLDVMMPKLDGLETLREIKNRQYPASVVMLSGAQQVKTAVEAMKHGAVDYLNKPFEIDELTNLILSLLEKAPPSVMTHPRKGKVDDSISSDFGSMVGHSGAMAELFDKIRSVASKETTVLITGESGTGKELVAREIHRNSKRASGPFIPVNCAAIPETLIESELFGHEKGAFTSAIETRIGQCELANGGTLFLDEIGELSLSVQVKLLRFLQDQEFYRVGRSKAIQGDVRIVAATNRDLEEMVREKKFRQDLFYRINVISLTIPALRDRYQDIDSLIAHFLVKYQNSYEGRTLIFSPEALESMVAYSWPGNVRELENVIESLLALAPNDTVSLEDLPRKISSPDSALKAPTQIFEGSLRFDEAERLFESEMIIKALKKTNYVQTRAAELLGISRRILKYKMDKLGIGEPTDPAT